MSHPIHSRNEDVACRWLCEHAGILTRKDEREVAEALQNLPFQGKPLNLGAITGRAA